MQSEGTIGLFQLVTYARALRQEEFTGLLELRKVDEYVQLTFLRGDLVHASSEDVRRSFPAFLLKHKLVERDAMRAALNDAQERSIPLNKVLLEQKILEPKVLQRSLESMYRYLIAYAFSLAPMTYTLTRLPDPPTILPRLDIRVENGLFQFISTQEDISEQSSALRDHFDSQIALNANFEELMPVMTLEFQGKDVDPVIEAISEDGASISQLLAGGHESAQIVRRVYAMLLSGMIRFESAELAEGNPWGFVVSDLAELPRSGSLSIVPTQELPTKAAAAATGTKGGGLKSQLIMLGTEQTQAKAQAIEALTAVSESGPKGGVESALLETLQRLQNETIYNLLGVTPDATLTNIREKCRSLNNKYDPKSYASFMLSKEAEKALSIISEHIRVAWAVLSDGAKRKAFHQYLGFSEAEMRVSLQDLADSAEISARAAKAMEKKAYGEAQTLLAEAMGLVPHDAALQANFAWVCFLGIASHELDAKNYKNLIETHMKEAAELGPKSEQVLRIQARIARMEHRNREAVEAYQRLLSVNARDEEARQGVRILRNTPDGTGPGDDSGVVDRISGIFKKK